MYVQMRPQFGYGYGNVMPILNYNIIREERQKDAIMAMGMAACQARCLRCSRCSDCGYGKGGGH